jgi:hypothetical protein
VCTTTRFIFMSVLLAGVAFRGSALAQPPKSMDLKVGDISLHLTNFAVVTGEAKYGGKLPDKPVPLPADKQLPPNAGVWITFDYETNFTKSDGPDGPSILTVGIELPKMKLWGYQTAIITEKSGKGSIGISMDLGESKPIEVNEAIKLVAAYRTNNKGEIKRSTSETSIPIRFRRDGAVTLSTTQFEEIQAMIRKVAELEKKVQALEGKKSP